MNPSQQVSPFAQAFQLGSGFAYSQAIVAFGKLGIPAILKDETKTTDEIAQSCNANAPALYRFLRFLSKLGVVELSGNACKLTAVGQMFRADVPGNINKGFELMSYAPWQETWNNMLHTLLHGQPSFRHIFSQDPWEYFRDNPQYGKPFNEWMTNLSKMSAGVLLKSYDFPEEGTICDVGGGHGFLLQTILEARPNLKGILFDLPHVVVDADLGNTEERGKIVGGNFFEKIPAADTIILKSILHDWDDEHAVTILKNCANSLNPGGKLLVMDMLISDNAGIIGYFYDIHMMLLLGGRERTEEEFETLFAKAGLKVIRIIPTGSPQVIIEAGKI